MPSGCSCHERARGSGRRAGRRAALDQRRDLVVGIARLAQHLLGVGAEHWTGALWTTRSTRELDRHAKLLDTFGTGLVELHGHVASAHELGVERLVELEHGLEAAVDLRRERLPLVARALEEDPLHLAVRVRPWRLELLLDQILALDAATPRLPELGLQCAQRDPAVAAGI